MKINLGHQKLTGEFHKHCRKKTGFKKIANKKRRELLKKYQYEN